MKKYLALLFLSTIIFAHSYAQEALFNAQQIVSPEIHDDNAVTFRLFAPAADSVKVTGDFLPTIKVQSPFGEVDAPGSAALVKDDKGVWTYKTEPLKPELYSYAFIVDGLRTTDPSNPFLIRDVASITNIFIIGGGHADLYKVNDIPHGTVAKTWYPSPGLKMDRRITIYTPPGYEKSNE
ncbi:MAG: esterase, partial [Fulvivirga sp.]